MRSTRHLDRSRVSYLIVHATLTLQKLSSRLEIVVIESFVSLSKMGDRSLPWLITL